MSKNSELPWKVGDIVGVPVGYIGTYVHTSHMYKCRVTRVAKTRIEVEHFDDGSRDFLIDTITKAVVSWTEEMEEQHELYKARRTLSRWIRAVDRSDLRTIINIEKIQSAIEALQALDCVK